MGNIAQAQNADQITNWDQNNSELKISSPITGELEVDQEFYLRYLQNLKSFEGTSKIEWKILNQNQKIVYQRNTESNQDKNEVVKISEPGSYFINLNLQINTKNVEISKKLQVIPKDKEYYKGLQFSEISLEKSQVEVWNNSNTDIDASALFFEYNASTAHQTLSKINIIPSKTFAVFDLNPKINPGKISLNFEKNLKKNTSTEIDQFDQLELLANPSSSGQSLQFNNEKQVWSWAKSTLGQKNVLSDNTHNNSFILASNSPKAVPNFQKIETVRTGGFDFKNLISLIPFLLIFTIFIFSLISENLESFDLGNRFKILAYWLNFTTEIEFYFLTKLILFKAA